MLLFNIIVGIVNPWSADELAVILRPFQKNLVTFKAPDFPTVERTMHQFPALLANRTREQIKSRDYHEIKRRKKVSQLSLFSCK